MRTTSTWVAAAGAALVALGCAGRAEASEGGASFYLLGSGGPEAAVTPPVEGVFFDDTFYVYDGSAKGNQQFDVGGNVVAGLHASIVADFASVAWVPSTSFVGGTFVIGGALPIGQTNVNVSAVITGPLGHSFGLTANDRALIVGDPIATAALGWKQGNFHEELSTTLNIPVGQYRDGQLANLSFHRWIDDVAFAFTWRNEKTGWDLSSKAGVTFNGTNPATQYRTGTEFHLEGSIEKTFSPRWSAALQAYWFDQLTGDSGAGDKVGPFEGRVIGVGATAARAFMAGPFPATLRFRVMTEFDVRNRIQGTSGWLDFTIPLSLRLPKPPPAS
jgi:hypothetical protein